MSLSVKAYLLILPEEQEIRRFSIDDGASSNFDYLLTKIRSVFPRIQNKPLRLFWKDEDGEPITFSSHEELVEALGSIQGDVFRVYINVLDQGDCEKEAQDSFCDSQAKHVGVVCDGCEHDIVGTRYKCVVCPDYDLCMKCEAKALHNHHEMFRICTPRVNPWFPAGAFPFAAQPPHPGFRPHHPPGCGPWGRGRGGHWRGPRFGRGRCGRPKGRCDKSTDDKCGQHAEDSASNSQEVPVGPPFLHAMGEAVASFLGPMGIEVHTYADNEPDCCQGRCNCDHNETSANETGETSAKRTECPEESPEKSAENMDSDSQSTSSKSSQLDGTPQTDDFVMIDKDKEKESAATDKTDGPDSIPDPLEIAIAQMKAMGFEDHDGWLSQLIVAKEYDIGKVLDAIQFSGKQ